MNDSTPIFPALARDEINGREIRAQAQQACAIAHGCGTGLSSNELWLIVLKHGLPSEEERARILAERLADAGGGTTPPHSPS